MKLETFAVYKFQYISSAIRGSLLRHMLHRKVSAPECHPRHANYPMEYGPKLAQLGIKTVKLATMWVGQVGIWDSGLVFHSAVGKYLDTT